MNNSPKQKTEYIGIRVTSKEKEAFENGAKYLGITLTDFIVLSCGYLLYIVSKFKGINS